MMNDKQWENLMAEWWQELLVGKMPDSPEELMALNARISRAF